MTHRTGKRCNICYTFTNSELVDAAMASAHLEALLWARAVGHRGVEPHQSTSRGRRLGRDKPWHAIMMLTDCGSRGACVRTLTLILKRRRRSEW